MQISKRVIPFAIAIPLALGLTAIMMALPAEAQQAGPQGGPPGGPQRPGFGGQGGFGGGGQMPFAGPGITNLEVEDDAIYASMGNTIYKVDKKSMRVVQQAALPIQRPGMGGPGGPGGPGRPGNTDSAK